MAKRVIQQVIVTDDITGEVIPEGEETTFTYAWAGSEYEIDLNETNADQVNKFMGTLIESSRKNGKYKPSVSTPPSRSVTGNSRAAITSGVTNQKEALRNFMREIRTWARDNGFPEQGPSGRLLMGVREAWNEAHPERQAPDEDAYRNLNRRHSDTVSSS